MNEKAWCFVGFRMNAGVLGKLDKMCAETGKSRSAVMRELVEKAEVHEQVRTVRTVEVGRVGVTA